MNAQPLAPQLPLVSAQSPLAFVIAAEGRLGYCGTCAAETIFERPWCTDGHGDLCAEWVCTDCGTAVIVEIGDYLEPVPAEAYEHVRASAGSRRVVAA
jgi:hypothetical protein